MPKSLYDLPKQIYKLFEEGHKPSSENLEELGKEITSVVQRRLTEPHREKTFSLRMSLLGKRCLRQLWYQKYHPDKAEELRAPDRIKFLFGDILEALLAFLTKEAGYNLTGRQDTLNIHGISGHRDGVIDGTTVDFKSASTLSFKKFEKPGALLEDDPFGYLTQLAAYTEADNTKDVRTDEAAFIAIDKQHGNIAVSKYKTKHLPSIKPQIERINTALSNKEVEPPQFYEDKPEGKSGNRKLCTECSYCAFKQHCWRNANDGKGLRLFLYSNKPIFLTHVEREPRVEEIQ